MANLSFGVQGPNMDFSVTMQVADTDAPRILKYLASTPYGTVVEGDVSRPATMEEVATGFARGILNGLLNQTVSYEKLLAAQEAANKITEISFSE